MAFALLGALCRQTPSIGGDLTPLHTGDFTPPLAGDEEHLK